MSIFFAGVGLPPWWQRLERAGTNLVKTGEASPAYNLQGLLYLSPDGWLLLSVPAPLIRGIFAAMHEPGIELPKNDQGKFEFAITVMSKDEVELIGADRVTERGKSFTYSLGRLLQVDPGESLSASKAWVVRVHSPALQALRRSYGLSSLPREDTNDFHCVVAVLRRGVLGRTATSKS